MLQSQARPVVIVAVSSLSLLVALALLHRWSVSELGLESYGRTWFYYVSYTDFGFTRRALLGTLLTVTGVNQVFPNAYHLAYAVHSLSLFLLVAMMAGVFFRDQSRSSLALLLAVFFSPVLILHSGYNTGALDLYLLIVVVWATFYVRGSIPFAIVLVVGSLVHELFIFTIPTLFIIHLIRSREVISNAASIKIVTNPVAAVAVTIACLRLWGTVSVSMHEFQSFMAQRIPAAAYKHPFWSGWYEVTAPLSDHVKYLRDLPSNLAMNPTWVLMIVYLAIVVRLLWAQAQGNPLLRALAVSTLIPVTACLIAGDVYRWIALSCSLALLTLLFLIRRDGARFNEGNLLWLLPFTLLAPFGTADPAVPFPMVQFVLEIFS